MRPALFKLCLVVAVLTLPVSVGAARVEPHWPYDKLFKEADLVVVARATAVEAADDRPADDGLKRVAELLKAQNTSFEVLHTLKGKAAGKTLRVLHFRYKPSDRAPPDNGPGLVAFGTKEGTEYLLFLKSRKDGRLEPVTGQYDSDLSARELRVPISAQLDE